MKSSDIVENFDINKPPKGVWVEQYQGRLRLGMTIRERGELFYTVVGIWASFSGVLWFFGNTMPWFMYMMVFLVAIFCFLVTFVFLAGKIQIILDDTHCNIFEGVWKIGLTKKYTLESLTVVKLSNPTGNEYDNQDLLMSNDIKLLSSGLCSDLVDFRDARHLYLLGVMRKVLKNREEGKNFLDIGLRLVDMSDHLIES